MIKDLKILVVLGGAALLVLLIASPALGQESFNSDTCNIDGVEMPGKCEDLQGEGTAQIDEKQFLKEVKKGLREPENGLRKFEGLLKDLQAKGIAIPDEVKEKVSRLKEILAAVKAAQTMEELQAAGADEAREIFTYLDQVRNELVGQAERLKEIKRGLNGLTQGLKNFEKQINKLKKQGLIPPAGVEETLQQLKTMLNAIKNAKSWEEVEAAGVENADELIETLHQYREQLEILSRWPKTLKQTERELKNLNRELKRAKVLVDRLAKKEIDVTSVYNAFEASINALKQVREEAVAKMQAGDSESAFDLLENGFFGQLEEAWSHFQTVMMMSNLGRFQADLKKDLAEAGRLVKRLKKKGLDVTALEEIINQGRTKGDAVIALIKTKPVDYEAVMNGLAELEDLEQTFDAQLEELTGETEEEEMPWEEGPEIFKNGPRLPKSWEKMKFEKNGEEVSLLGT